MTCCNEVLAPKTWEAFDIFLFDSVMEIKTWNICISQNLPSFSLQWGQVQLCLRREGYIHLLGNHPTKFSGIYFCADIYRKIIPGTYSLFLSYVKCRLMYMLAHFRVVVRTTAIVFIYGRFSTMFHTCSMHLLHMCTIFVVFQMKETPLKPKDQTDLVERCHCNAVHSVISVCVFYSASLVETYSEPNRISMAWETLK